MKKYLLIFCLMSFILHATKPISIIPQPVSITQKTGQFKFNQKTTITGTNKKQNQFFSELLAPAFGRKLKLSKTQRTNAIVCKIDTSLLTKFGKEAYTLNVS